MKTNLNRNQMITLVKELVAEGKIVAPKAPNSLKTTVLQELIDSVEKAVEAKVLGRKINPNSARQMKLAEIAAAKEAAGGELQKGRKVNPNSARQMRIAAREAALENGELQKGRKINPNSARQIALAERKAILDAGGVIPKGRPKMEKVEVAADNALLVGTEC